MRPAHAVRGLRLPRGGRERAPQPGEQTGWAGLRGRLRRAVPGPVGRRHPLLPFPGECRRRAAGRGGQGRGMERGMEREDGRGRRALDGGDRHPLRLAADDDGRSGGLAGECVSRQPRERYARHLAAHGGELPPARTLRARGLAGSGRLAVDCRHAAPAGARGRGARGGARKGAGAGRRAGGCRRAGGGGRRGKGAGLARSHPGRRDCLAGRTAPGGAGTGGGGRAGGDAGAARRDPPRARPRAGGEPEGGLSRGGGLAHA